MRSFRMAWLGGVALAVACTNLDGLSSSSSSGGAPDGGDGAASSGFTDETFPGEFEKGTFADTRWVGDHVELAPGARKGDFTSRVFDANAANAAWKTIRWVPGGPYDKPLPDHAAAENGYRTGAVDMATNVLLLHFEGALTDTSPTSTPLLATGLGPFVPGVFGSALDDSLAGYVYGTVAAGGPFDFGTAGLTWALWVRTTASCPGNAVYMGAENPPGATTRRHMWLGCTPLGDAGLGTIGDTFCSARFSDGGDDCADVLGSRPITDGVWHHVAIVKSGHAPGTMTIYLDGTIQGAANTSFAAPLDFDPGVDFGIGGFSRGTYPAQGTFDEVAIWRRALSADEVRSLWRRGALRMTLQVRACGEPTCTGVDFVGPGGDSAQSFVDPANALAPPDAQPVLASGRYAQYRVHFESLDDAASPALYAVTLSP